MNDASEPTAATAATGGGRDRRPRSRTDRRLRRALAADRDADEALVTWTRAWISRDGRWNRVVAARTRDFALVTDRRLALWSIGFFTRRPRHCVYAQPLELVVVYDQGPKPGRRLRVTGRDVPPLMIELGSSSRAAGFVSELVGRAGLARKFAGAGRDPKSAPA